MKPAQDRPSGVFSSYFMSMYALFAVDMKILLPAAAPSATSWLLVVVPQNWATPEVGGVALRNSCQAAIFLPVASTIGNTRSKNLMKSGSVVTCASSPPRCRYSPGVSSASSLTTSCTNLYVISLSMQSELKPTSVPVYSGGATPSQFSSA